jgi:hypothetical protein
MENNNKIEIYWDSKNRVSYYYSHDDFETLRKEHNITSEGLGTLRKLSKQNNILKAPYMLNKFDTAYLYLK